MYIMTSHVEKFREHRSGQGISSVTYCVAYGYRHQHKDHELSFDGSQASYTELQESERGHEHACD
jgi:hypothetical protein